MIIDNGILILIIFGMTLLRSLISLISVEYSLFNKIESIIIPIGNFVLSLILLLNFRKSYLVEIHGTNLLFIEPIFLIFLSFVQFMWLVCNLYIIGYTRQQHYDSNKKLRLDYLISLSIFFSLITVAASNIILLTLAYELLTITTFFLVKFNRDEASTYAGKFYFLSLSAIAMFFFTPIIALCIIHRDISMYLPFDAANITLAFLIGFIFFGSAKAAQAPFCGWLIKAMAAPIPVSALLHAVVVVKTGILVILKFYVYKIGPEKVHNLINLFPLLKIIISTSIIFTIVFAAIYAYKQHNVKLSLAYSTISQLGLIIIPVLNFGKTALPIMMLQLISHGFAKIILFFIAGENYYQTKSLEISALRGFYKQNKVLSYMFLIASLSLAGVPIFTGFWTKVNMMNLFHHNTLHLIIIFLSSILSLSYLSNFLREIFTNDPNRTMQKSAKTTIISVSMALSGLIMLPFLSNYIILITQKIWN